MDKSTITSLNRRLLDNFTNRTLDSAPREMRVPASDFCCPDHFAAERETIFRGSPQPIAFSAEISAAGSYLALNVLDVPLLLTRDEGGRLRAFINSCGHRGAQLASGQGTRNRLVCPFHGWAYGLDGQLAGRPGDEHFQTTQSDCSLVALPVSEKYGIVVVGTRPDLPLDEVNSALDEVGSDLESFGLAGYRPLERRQFSVKANWKLVNDLSLESYHFATLHRDSVAQVLTANSVVDTYRRSSRWAFPLKSVGRLADLDEQEWPEAVEGSVTYTLYPGVMVIVNALGAQMIRAEPGGGPGESTVIYTGVARPDCDLEQARQAYDFGGQVFAEEDLPVAEQCQRGLEATGRDQVLGGNEPLLQFWHRLWQQDIE